MGGSVLATNEADQLIDAAARRGFLWHMFRADANGPEVLAGMLRWPTCADVVVLIDNEHTHAYRVPTGCSGSDVFAPDTVHWFYGNSAEVGMVWVLRALLTLPRPDEPDGLLPPVLAPARCGVPGGRYPVVVRRRQGVQRP